MQLRTAFAACLLLIGSRFAAAQDVRGTVRDGASGQPIPSAVLLLLDSAGVTLGRTITDARGQYRITTVAALRRMRVVRIGFRPSEVALPPYGATATQVDVTMTAIPTLLDPVQVRAGAQCSKRDDRIIALSLLEQARAGLLATIVARETRPAEMIRLVYRRHMDGISDNIHSQAVQVDSSTNVSVAFQAARQPDEFVEQGFMRDDGETQMFYGPDAATLLDDGFRDGYCFRLHDADRARPNQVGLSFEPARTKRGRIDIDGTLWIDTSARALKEIVYDFVGLDGRLSRVHPGGVVHFLELANGVVLIDHWHFRLPATDQVTYRSTIGGFTLGSGLYARESGGVVASAVWPDGFSWSAPLATVRIHATDKLGHPLIGRGISFEETNYFAVSDSTGTAVIERVLPGPYKPFAGDSILAALGLHAPGGITLATSAGTVTEKTFRVPTALDYVRAKCAQTGIPVDSAGVWLLGRAIGIDSVPVRNTEFRIYDETMDSRGYIDGGKTDSDGVLPYCGDAIARKGEIRIEVRRSSSEPWSIGRVTANDRLTTFVVTLPRPREK